MNKVLFGDCRVTLRDLIRGVKVKMPREVSFVVPGHPVGKGRPRIVARHGFARAYTPEKTANYESLVALCAKTAMAGKPLMLGAVAVELDIMLAIPASWSRKRQDMARRGEIAAVKKPDIDNTEKAIYDACNGIVWRDDVQVVEVTKRKRYADVPGVMVKVKEI